MPSPAASTSSDPLEELLAAALRELQEGGESALSRFLDGHPDERAELARELERLRGLGLVDFQAAAPRPERVGDFRLLERIGSGGMGVVYEAEQISLGRRVAVKLVRPELLFFDTSRSRFRREVAAAAGLCHPGIAQVFAGGEEHGTPWYAMELVEGAPLDELLQDLEGRDPAGLAGDVLRAGIERRLARSEGHSSVGDAAFAGSWTELALRIARQVAEALEHAHGRGVVHRDVKPSNVLVTRTGRAILVDFGLALSGEAERITRSGAQPGSLPYMSPEQLAGAAVDARTDIYSLGVTLRELLALRPAFAGGEHQVRSAIAEGRLAPWPRGVPADVRTVVACAMERDPARRYATAADLARDLANLIERRPIDAQRPGWSLRLVRSGQRHPRLAAAALTAVLLGLAASLVVLGSERDHSRALLTERNVAQGLADDLLVERNVARGLADDLRVERDGARELSREIQEIAASLVREVHTAIADLPAATAARETLVARATQLLESLRARGFDDPELRAELAFAHLSLGQVLCATLAASGPDPAALEHFRAARAIIAGLAEPSVDSQAHWVTTFLGEARALLWSDPERSLELVREVLEPAAALAAEHPGDDELLALSMDARLLLASHLDTRAPEESAELLAGVVRDGQGIFERGGASAAGVSTLVQALRDQAAIAANASRTPEALESYQGMERVARAMVAASVNSKTARQMLIQALIGQGEQLYRLASLSDAAEALSAASAESDAIRDPLDLSQTQDRLRLAFRVWQVRRELGELEAAAEALREGAAACEAAIAPADSTPLAAMFVRLLVALAVAELDVGRLDAAQEAFSRASTRLDAVDRLALESAAFLYPRYMLRDGERKLHGLRGDAHGELAAARDAVALLRRLCAAQPSDMTLQIALAVDESQLAAYAAALAEPGDWLVVHERSVESLRELRRQDPARAAVSEALTLCLLRRAGARLAVANGPEAEADFAEALGLAEEVLGPANLRAGDYAAEARQGLAAARELQVESRP